MLKKLLSSPKAPPAKSVDADSHHTEAERVPILTADLWRYIIAPKLGPSGLNSICLVSRWFYYQLGALWKKEIDAVTASLANKGKKHLAKVRNVLPADSHLWRLVYRNIKTMPKDMYWKFCASYTRRYRKDHKAASFPSKYEPLCDKALVLIHKIHPVKKVYKTEKKEKQTKKFLFLKEKHENPEDDEIRIVLVGSGGIGCKSSLCVRFLDNRFLEEYDPTIEDSYRKTIKLDTITRKLNLLDTAGQEEFTTLMDEWCKPPAEGFLVGYAVTSISSYKEVHRFHRAIRRLEPRDFPGAPTRPIVLIGNKIDYDEHAVSFADGVRLAERLGANAFIAMSVKNDVNCTIAFETIARLILMYREELAEWKTPATVEEFYDKSEFVNPPHQASSSLLHYLLADKTLRVDLIRKILSASPNHVVYWRDENLNTPLHILTARTTLPNEMAQARTLLKLLLEKGADPFVVNDELEMPMHRKANPPIEMLMIMRAHLERKIRWEKNALGGFDWFAQGPFFGVENSLPTMYRNGVPCSPSASK